MEGPMWDSNFPILTYARVVGYDSLNHAVIVSLPSMQQIGVSAKILINGPADSTRVEQMPLPILGTWGLVAVPFGDTKSAIWMGSFYQSLVKATTTSNPPTDEDGQIKYTSHASGTYSILDYDGNYFWRSPDGTSLAVNISGIAPTIYRFTVDESGNLAAIKFEDVDRDQNPPNPFYIQVNHPSGASISVTPSGLVTVQSAVSQASGAGPLIILDPVTQNLYIKGQKALGQIIIDPNGNIKIISNQDITIDASASGDIFVKTNQHTSESIDNIINTYNGHTHSDPQGGNTGAPNQQLP